MTVKSQNFNNEVDTEKSVSSILSGEEINGLASFFDLLSRFDYEDKKNEYSVIDTSSLTNPREPVSQTEDNLDNKPAIRTSGKTCSLKQDV
ncbi:MAG TPA: hypothetical protein VJG67_00730 [Candidatus Paceibacterota bacterium]